MANEEKYSLSLTAEEIDSRLQKVQDGGVGYTEGETIHTIDPKYLPPSGSGGIPVVDLGITVKPWELTDADGNAIFYTLSDEVSAQLNAFAESNTPIAVALQSLYKEEYPVFIAVTAMAERTEMMNISSGTPESAGLSYVAILNSLSLNFGETFLLSMSPYEGVWEAFFVPMSIFGGQSG